MFDPHVNPYTLDCKKTFLEMQKIWTKTSKSAGTGLEISGAGRDSTVISDAGRDSTLSDRDSCLFEELMWVIRAVCGSALRVWACAAASGRVVGLWYDDDSRGNRTNKLSGFGSGRVGRRVAGR